MNKWISVFERLPARNEVVCVADGVHIWDVGMYQGYVGNVTTWKWRHDVHKVVLWWMPKLGALPEPPVEVDNDRP